MGGVRILNNPELLITIKKIPVITSHPKGTKALRRATVKAIAAEKMVTKLGKILAKSRGEIKRLKPTRGTKNSAYQDFQDIFLEALQNIGAGPGKEINTGPGAQQ